MTRLAGETAVVVVTDVAEPVVGRWRNQYDEVAPLGVPAHVTVLYPFLPRTALTPEVLARLREIVAAERAFELTFRGFGRFPGSVLWLDPEPAEPFRRLTYAVWEAWPHTPPYEGQFDDVTPHLTVAEHTDDGVLDAIAADVRPGLPVTMRVVEAALLAVGNGTWRTLATFALGASASAQPTIRSAPA